MRYLYLHKDIGGGCSRLMFSLQEERGDHPADPFIKVPAWLYSGGGAMLKNNLKISQMEKRCLPCRKLDENGGEAWYENEA